MPVAYGLKEIFDVEGRIHRVLYVDCSCCSTTPSIKPLRGMGSVSYSAVCRDADEQDHLLDVVKRFGATKLVFSGCMIESLPVNYKDSLRFLGCSIQSLNLSHISVIRTDGDLVDCELAMAWLREPWSDSSAEERCLNLIESRNVVKLIHGDTIPFGLNLQPDEIWMSEPNDSLIEKVQKLGKKVTYVSN